MQDFESWYESVGLNLSLTHLPTLQVAVVQWSLLKIIGLSCKACSQLRSCLPVVLNEHVTVGDRISVGIFYFECVPQVLLPFDCDSTELR